MKKYLAVVIFIVCAIPAFTQKNYLDKVADSTCQCLEKGKEKIKSAADFDKLGEICIMKAATPYLDSFARDENIPVEELDDKLGDKLGQKIGLKLVTNCPVFVELMAAHYTDDEKNVITGLVTGVQISDHVYLTIKEPSGKITKVVWLEYFSGADTYKSNPARLNGKKVEVEWEETDLYYIAKKDFITVKVITKLVVK